MTNRSQTRKDFLNDIFTCAIENYGYGAFQTLRYKWQNLDEPFAEIQFDDDPAVWRVDLDTIAHGLGVIHRHAPELLYLSFGNYKMILEADRENDACQIDTGLALAILECALFGKVVYA